MIEIIQQEAIIDLTSSWLMASGVIGDLHVPNPREAAPRPAGGLLGVAPDGAGRKKRIPIKAESVQSLRVAIMTMLERPWDAKGALDRHLGG
jgi:hypothetical protein